MSNPKEKAETMVLKYTILINYDFVSDLKFNNPNDGDRNRRVKKDAKKCALAAVEEILIEIRKIYDILTSINIIKIYKYWEKVKNEIEKL
jgi:hypothetical protein